MAENSDFRYGIPKVEDVTWKDASVGADHKVTISGSFTYAGKNYEVKIKYNRIALASKYGKNILEDIDDKIKNIVGRIGADKLAGLKGHSVIAGLGKERTITLLRGSRQLEKTEYGQAAETVEAIDRLFDQNFPNIRAQEPSKQGGDDDFINFSFIAE